MDFFRGIGMYIIFVAHMNWSPFFWWIPARFGFSDATEIFVFCSGMASAIAFAKVFDSHGMLIGAARVAHRTWQVYWSHILLFFTITTMLAAIDASSLGARDYTNILNLDAFINDAANLLPALFTLTYVPNYFDILPMYIGILIMLPIVMGLSKISPALAGVFVVGLWLSAQFFAINLPAEPWSERKWFFNPFAWQLVFFTGFALMRGWIPAPPVDRRLVIGCIVFLLVSLPFAYFPIYNAKPDNETLQSLVALFKATREEYKPLINKTNFGLLRYLHFLSLAYVSWVAVGEGGKRLLASGLWGMLVKAIQKVGQQSLAVFLSSMVLAQLFSVLRDQTTPPPEAPMLLNLYYILGAFVLLTIIAYVVGWFKSTPWKKPSKTALAGGPGRHEITAKSDSGDRSTKRHGALSPAE
ncbi:MAG: OpgC domain-containing protein [Stappiaceae bacterium]